MLKTLADVFDLLTESVISSGLKKPQYTLSNADGIRISLERVPFVNARVCKNFISKL